MLPRAKVIALLVNPSFPQTGPTIRDMQEAARVKTVLLPILKASSESEIGVAFASLAELRADGLVVEGNPSFEGHGGQSQDCQCTRPHGPACDPRPRRRGHRVKRRAVLALLAGATMPLPFAAGESAKVFRLGVLQPLPPGPGYRALVQQLLALGWEEGRNLRIGETHASRLELPPSRNFFGTSSPIPATSAGPSRQPLRYATKRPRAVFPGLHPSRRGSRQPEEAASQALSSRREFSAIVGVAAG
jgi:hypothetical protein